MMLEDKIKNAFKEECPDILEQVMQSIEDVEQLPAEKTVKKKSANKFLDFISGVGIKKVSAIAACFVLVFTLGVLLGNGLALVPNDPSDPAQTPSYASLYIDVNPSIELVLDTDKKVVECKAANEDAEAVLNGMELNGVSMHTALNAIIGSMYMNGYLNEANETNTILISTKTEDESKFGSLLSEVANDVNTILERSNIVCSIVAQKLTDDLTDADTDDTDKSNVSLGKSALVNKILSALNDSNYDFKTLAGMSLKELNSLYHSIMDEHEDEGDRDDEIFFGKPQTLNANSAIDAVLAHLSYERSEVSDIQAHRTIAINPEDDELESVYKVSFKIDGTKYTYAIEIDYEDSDDIWEVESILDQIPGIPGLDDILPVIQ